MNAGSSEPDSLLGQFARFALLAAAAACALLILLDPIKYTDTDCWIHLSGGQYFFQHGDVPRDSYFSFIEPPRPWLSYAWAFQAIIYLIHSAAGYQGLLIFRTLLYIGMEVLVLRFLFRRGPGERAPIGWLAFIGFLVTITVLGRYFNIRPHLFTYLLIITFLYILELRPRHAVWLPLLGVVWCNVHGIAFPVMLLITGAYAIEYLIRRSRPGTHDPAEERRVFVPTVLTMATVYVTPLGGQLFEAPGRSLDYLTHFVNELIVPTFQEMTTVSAIQLTPNYWTYVNVLVLAALLALLSGINRRTLRPSHVLLFLGGAYLLSRGKRFAYEFALLSLPLLRANPVVERFGKARVFASPAAAWGLALLLIAGPVGMLVALTQTRGNYPFSNTGLPEGICTFLDRLGGGGRVFNGPNSGGYLRWRLYPKYKILIDMDSYFEDSDFYTARKMLSQPHLLGQMLERYDPSFITVPSSLVDFHKMMVDFPDYRPVFIDDAEVLYASRRHVPELVRQYELRALSPSKVLERSAADLAADESSREEVGRETGRMLAVYPAGGNLNHLMGLLYLEERRYDRVLEHAVATIKAHPEFASGYLLEGDALVGLGDLDGALAAYRTSLQKSGSDWAVAHKQIGEVYLDLRQYEKAYRSFVKAVDPLQEDTTTDDLYLLAWAALKSGHTREARALLTFLLEYKLTPGDTEWLDRVRGVMKAYGLEADPHE